MTSDYREDTALTRVQPLESDAADEMTSRLHALADEASEQLRLYGFNDDEIEVLHRVDVRYAGQDHTLTAAIEKEWFGDEAALLAGVRERFVAAHTQLYGHGTLDPPLELVTSRARAVGRVARPKLAAEASARQAEPRTRRDVYLRGAGRVDTPVYDRQDVDSITGPAIIEEWTTTIVVPPGWGARSDRLGNLTLERT